MRMKPFKGMMITLTYVLSTDLEETLKTYKWNGDLLYVLLDSKIHSYDVDLNLISIYEFSQLSNITDFKITNSTFQLIDNSDTIRTTIYQSQDVNELELLASEDFVHLRYTPFY